MDDDIGNEQRDDEADVLDQVADVINDDLRIEDGIRLDRISQKDLVVLGEIQSIGQSIQAGEDRKQIHEDEEGVEQGDRDAVMGEDAESGHEVQAD